MYAVAFEILIERLFEELEFLYLFLAFDQIQYFSNLSLLRESDIQYLNVTFLNLFCHKETIILLFILIIAAQTMLGVFFKVSNQSRNITNEINISLENIHEH
jgi:hypothetical protein